MVLGIAGEKALVRSSGKVPTQYRVVDADTGSQIAIGPTATGITQTAATRFKATPQCPKVVGDYEIQWDDGSNTWDPGWVEDLKVINPADVPRWFQTLLIAP